MKPPCFSSIIYLKIRAIIVILVSVWIIWFFLYRIPSDCIRIAAESGGWETCGFEYMPYVILGICIVLVLAAVHYIIKLHMKKTP
jgi:hypothetical protein